MIASAAAEANPTPGWYTVGNGYSTDGLADCSWTEYKPDFRLKGTQTGTSSEGYINYLGTWTTGELELYADDQFKFLYESGEWAYPNDSGWGADIVADFTNLTGDIGSEGDFIYGALGNIQVNQGASAYYTFSLTVTEDTTGVHITLSYEKGDSLDDPVTAYDMYLVGEIESEPTLGWPYTSYPDPEDPDVQIPYEWDQFHMTARWVIETEEGEDKGQVVQKYYTEVAIDFVTSDQMKVYNAANRNYYPGGVFNNVSPETAGKYYVEWKLRAPSIRFVASIPVGQPAPTEPDPDPGPNPPQPPQPTYPTAGWYLVGNGAGTLYDCSWTKYLSDYRLGGVAFDGSSEKDYLGFWKTQSLLLYQGDQFKFLYQNGRWATPDASGWQSSYTAGFSDLSANNSGNAFSSVGEDIIQVNKSGYYTFYIHVAKSTGGVAITLTFNLTSTNVPSKTLEDMYIVGSVASVPACGWPDDVDVTSNCIKMTRSAYDEKWYSPAIRLTAADEIKVYNLANHGYYPSFFDDNFSVATSGWYIIQWESGSQTLTAIPVPNNFAS